jgi:hypothetical protein
MLEKELEKLQGTKFQLEVTVNTLESGKINQETMLAMKKAADALKTIHGDLYVYHMVFPRCVYSTVGDQLDRPG